MKKGIRIELCRTCGAFGKKDCPECGGKGYTKLVPADWLIRCNGTGKYCSYLTKEGRCRVPKENGCVFFPDDTSRQITLSGDGKA